jgi:hypothetical protein
LTASADRLCLGLYRERGSLAWVNTNIFDYNRQMKHQAQQQQSGASPILLPLLTTEFSFFL